MNLIRYEGYNLTIEPEMLLIKPFKVLWDRDKSKTKENALMELGYIYFMCDPRSDYMYLLDEDGINNSSMVYRADMGGKTMMVMGDLSLLGGERLLEDRGDELKSDIVVLAHHGRGGVGEDVYKAIDPEIVIWPTTEKIYNSEGGIITRSWFDKISVKKEVLSFESTYLIK
jgi:hypothetical protein